MIDQSNNLYFNEVYDETYDKVLRYVSFKCSDINCISDIIQDVYLDMYSIIINKKYDHINNMEAFIINIAKKS